MNIVLLNRLVLHQATPLTMPRSAPPPRTGSALAVETETEIELHVTGGNKEKDDDTISLPSSDLYLLEA